MKKLKVNTEMCVGCGLCIGTNPDVFEFDDEGHAKVIDEIDESLSDEVQSNCPVSAIEEE